MIKLKVKVKKRPFKLKGFGVYVGNTYHKRLWMAETKEECVDWAIRNNCEVIEE